MARELLFSVSQTGNEAPYQFAATGQRVYSFEEALYHVFHNWKQSADDIISDGFVAWVNDSLSLSHLAARISALAGVEPFNKRIIAFLKLADYFEQSELESLRPHFIRWEKRRDWEKLKERADYHMGRNEPERAAALYRRALKYEENAALYNNLGVALMRMEEFEEAYECINKASEFPGGQKLELSRAEAAIYCGRYDEAERILFEKAAADPENADVLFLYGLMYFTTSNYIKSAEYYRRAIGQSKTPDPYYVLSLADVYAKIRQFERALEVLELIKDKDTAFYVKQAELFAASGNIPAAVKAIRAALVHQNGDAMLWAKLATYHRLDYDLHRAAAAATKALTLDPENERARLEDARIKKGLGRTREYQAALNGILKGFRKKYRELNA